MNKLQSFILSLGIAIILSLLWVVLLPNAAKAQLFNDWDPGFKVTKDGKVIAPFADPDKERVSQDNELFKLYAPDDSERGSDLTKAHRTDAQIAEWASNVFVENFELTNDTLRPKLNKARPYFSDKAWQDLSTFLKNKNRLSNLQKGRMSSIKLLSRREPQVIKTEQKPDRIYSWVVRVPILMELRAGDRASTREIDFLVQVVRTKDAPDDQGVIIRGLREAVSSG